MDTKYFRIPFATSGDVVTVPDGVQTDGSVSYTSGYGPDYALDPGTNPAALLIERTKMNEIFLDITSSLARLQQFFAPQWITSSDNNGTPYAYANGAIVLYDGDGLVYQSIVTANTATPGSDPTKWIVFLSNLATVTALAAEATARATADALLAPKANPIFTGNVNVGTRSPGDSTDNAASTAFVGGAVSTETTRALAAEALLAPKANPALTGNVGVPTRSPGDSTANAASTAFLQTALAALSVVSTDQPIVGSTSFLVSHTFGSADLTIQPMLICQTAEFGFSAGDVVPMAGWNNTSGQGFYATKQSGYYAFVFGPGSGGHVFNICGNNLTNANWKFRVKLSK